MNNIFIREISAFTIGNLVSQPQPSLTSNPNFQGHKLKSLILDLLSLIYAIVFKLPVPFEELFST